MQTRRHKLHFATPSSRRASAPLRCSSSPTPTRAAHWARRWVWTMVTTFNRRFLKLYYPVQSVDQLSWSFDCDCSTIAFFCCLALILLSLFSFQGAVSVVWRLIAALNSFNALIIRQNIYFSTPKTALRFRAVVGPSGLEPPTSRLSVVRSNQLSYGPSSSRTPLRFALGGDKRTRTADFLLAKQALSQLSYTPEALSSAELVVPSKLNNVNVRA